MTDNILPFNRGSAVAADALHSMADEIAKASPTDTVLLIRVSEGQKHIAVYEFGPKLTPLERIGATYAALGLFDSRSFVLDPLDG